MTRTLLSLLLITPLTSCAWLARTVTPTHAIDARTAGPLILDVCDQHDESVARDAALVPAEREQALRSSAIVREVVRAATEDVQ
jgi:hypothetical protein